MLEIARFACSLLVLAFLAYQLGASRGARQKAFEIEDNIRKLGQIQLGYTIFKAEILKSWTPPPVIRGKLPAPPPPRHMRKQ